MSGRTKVVILGGSALATPGFFDEFGKQGAKGAYEIVLFGRDEERLELVKKVSQYYVDTYPDLDVKIATSRVLESAVAGADYCINQIRVGGLKGRATDETFPRQFGIPGEETVGPGGFNCSLRGIPVILDICRTLENLAPEVTLLNLTNPSSVIQYAIRKYTKVNVVGTCDSPVSLMELIAKVLEVDVRDLEFDLAGMHHFSWVTSVRHQGDELLPGVLEKAEEMPKLGVDPELIRTLGVIPSFYQKYYFHPDRILAQTEGRTIRAHQVMNLTDQLLEEYRAWQPDSPPTMVAKRGAAWYKKIVVPALLAFTERQTTELVLSVDNRNTLPWLPEDAIVEAPVQVSAGKIERSRGANFPENIKAMIVQNCVYEMSAAEAIAERDRDKAVRSLLANLLVSNYNQARGILDVIWPEDGVQKFTAFSPKAYKESDLGFKVPRLTFGDGLVEAYDPQEADYALITMEELWDLVKERFTRLPDTVMFVRELDWYNLEAMEQALPQVSLVVGLGGGVAQDAAKYVGWRRHLPVDEFVSITSVDASVTKSIAARAGGNVTYIGYIVPRNVYMDYPLIQSAPARLNRSGVGDILCSHVALCDWKLAHEHTGEAYDPGAVSEMRSWLERIEREAEEIREVTGKGIRLVMEAFAEISIICRRFGSSRPQEGSDHAFAYNAEFQTGKQFLHGELVALGAWVLANLQDNQPEYLSRVYAQTGILWQPADIGLTKEEFIRILQTLNWYQKNFGRRYTILDEQKIDSDFTDRMVAQLNFGD